MTIEFRRPMLLLGTTLLIIQATSMPIGMVYAETTIDTEEQEIIELSPIKTHLEEEQISDPRFFFTRSKIKGTVDAPLQVTFFSDQEVSAVRVSLPEEATLLKDQLQTGISVEEGVHHNEWIVKSERAQNTFVLPLVVEKAGNYELSVEETTAHLEIGEQEVIIEEAMVKETESSDDDPTGQEDLKEENGIEENQENDQSTAEGRDPVSEAPQEQQSDEEEGATVFDGEIAEVTTMAQFREAVANPDIGTISVQANLTGATANILSVERPLLIQGNGYTLTFGNNGFYFYLAESREGRFFRIENATIAKVGARPLINSSEENSYNWTVEIEDVAEVNANNMRLASIPNGRIVFTGGNNNFTRTNSTQTFIEAKEIKATNQAQVFINRGNAIIFFSGSSIVSPSLTIENGAEINIRTVSGLANAIDYRGEDAEILVTSKSRLEINAPGTTSHPTDTTNNVVAMTNNNPKISIEDNSELIITTNQAKRGIHLSGYNPTIQGENSIFKVSSTTQTAINIAGEKSLFFLENSSVSLGSTTGQRLTINGDNSKFSLVNSEVEMNASTGRGIWIGRLNPQVILDSQSRLEIQNTGNAQALILEGRDALLEIKNKSEFNVTGSGTGNHENIQIGVNNENPSLRILNDSELSVTTPSGTGTASNTANNVLHLRGDNPKTIISNGSKLNIDVTAGARRAFLLNGNNGSYVVNGGSQYHSRTRTGINTSFIGSNTDFTLSDNESFTSIISESNNAINMGSGSFNVLNGGSFEATAQTSTATNGTIAGGILNIIFDTPSRINIANNRPAGGNLFSVSNGSSLKSINSDLELWFNGSNLNGDSQRSWVDLSFEISGANFNTLSSSNHTSFNTSESSFGNVGLTAYSRMLTIGRELTATVPPVDPLNPEVEVDPDNKPDLPDSHGLLSIDFISQFNFGTKKISTQDRTYFAQPQRLLKEDGTVNETEERPNYVQISDRRLGNERNGWQLAVTQQGQFEDEDDQELLGARLRLMNQQVVSAQNGAEPHLQQTNPLTLIPNAKRVLLLAQGDEGTGTWVYRFGDADTAGESIALDVPKGATPQATRYTTTLLWELSAVPEN